ncbi:MAG: lipid biosynthesis B12-binding/radical SAM protein [Kiritimatiellia bacterium]
MRVLLVSANRERVPCPVAPIGLLYLAEVLLSRGVEVSILDLCFSDDVESDIRRRLKEFPPSLIGVSIRNIDNLSFPGIVSYVPGLRRAVTALRRNSEAPVVLGGSAFSLFPARLLEELDCDLGVTGEGEQAFAEIAGLVSAGNSDFSGVPNVVRRSAHGFQANPVSRPGIPDLLTSRELIENNKYFRMGGMGNIQTKRGCSFKCSYCTYPLIEGRKYRLREPESVAGEMELLEKRYNLKHVFMVDDVFNCPVDHAEAVCESIIAKSLSVQWSCFASPGHVTGRLMKLMKRAGCRHVEFGSDGLSPEILESLNKSFTVEQVFEASRECMAAGLKCAHYVMFGGPGETRGTLHRAFENIQRLECTAVIVMTGIRIYPRTELEKRSLAEGITGPGEDLLEPKFYLSPEVPPDMLLKEVSDFAAKSPHCVAPGLNIRSSGKMLEVLRRHYRHGPLWGYLGGARTGNEGA